MGGSQGQAKYLLADGTPPNRGALGGPAKSIIVCCVLCTAVLCYETALPIVFAPLKNQNTPSFQPIIYFTTLVTLFLVKYLPFSFHGIVSGAGLLVHSRS